jgi:hypothetical protein
MAIVLLIGSFLLGAVLSGVASAVIAVYWLGAFDSKFRDAPLVAFELEMWGLLALCLVALVVTVVAGLFFSGRLSASPRSMVSCALWGVAYPLLPRVILALPEHFVDAENLLVPVVGWLYLIAFPALALFTLRVVKPHGQRHAL